MAKQTKSTVAPAAGAASPAGTAAPVAATPRGENDKFIAIPVMDGDKQKLNEKSEPVWAEPTKKLAPQAMVIINTIRAAGPTGITRSQLNTNLKGVLVTRQPESRIVTYYQKTIQESGAVRLDKGIEAVPATVAPARAAVAAPAVV